MGEQVNSRPNARVRKSGCGCGGGRKRQVVSGQKGTSVAGVAVGADVVVEVDGANGTVRADKAKVADAVVVAEVVNGTVVADVLGETAVANVTDVTKVADAAAISKGTESSNSEKRLSVKENVQTQKVSNQTAQTSRPARARATTKPFFSQAELRKDAMRKQKKRS